MSSTNKNKATNKFKAAVIGKRVSPSTEDRAMGRLLIIIGITLAAVAFMIIMRRASVGSISLMGWLYINVYPWFRWVAAALCAASVVWYVYSRYFAMRDETDALFTTTEIVGCAASLAFASWYLYASDNFYPTLVFVIAAGLLGVASQMMSPLFFRFTFLTCLGAGFWWLANTTDILLGNIGLYLIAALIVAVFVALKISEKNNPADNVAMPSVAFAFPVLAVLCVVTAIISCAASVAMPYVIYAYIALFVVTSIICTVKKR